MDIDYQSKVSKVVNGIAPSAIRRFFDLANETDDRFSDAIFSHV